MPNMVLQTVLRNQDDCRLFEVIFDPLQHLAVSHNHLGATENEPTFANAGGIASHPW